MHGGHCIKSWSTTQSVTALSSGEAELYGIIRGASMSLGFAALAADMGTHLEVEIYSDSAAARGMVRRTGLGKVRHIHVEELWVQEALRMKRFELKAIAGASNPADILTKHVERGLLDRYCPAIGLSDRAGRSAAAPLTQSG